MKTRKISESLPSSGFGWFKAMRGPEPLELIRLNSSAFILGYVIAYRARWHSGFNAHELQPGEAFLGDYTSYGLTRQNYRTALRLLERLGFATFRATNRGTIARLCDKRLFDILHTTPNQKPNPTSANAQPAANQQATTNKELTRTEDQESKFVNITKHTKSNLPTLDQVQAEAVKISLPSSEADRFFDHYEANGWKAGPHDVRSWQACLRTWKRNWEEGRYSSTNMSYRQTARPSADRKWGNRDEK